MAVLVTGGAGFVGLNLVEALLERGEEVILFDSGALPPAAQRALSHHGRQLNVARADVRDAAQVNQVFESHRIDYIAHCAAVTSGPARESRDPATIIEINVQGTLNILEAARAHAVKRVVYSSSGAVYGESLYRLARLYEEDPVMPITLYGITKFAAERLCARMRALWEIDVVCARLGTVIGPWERDTGVRDNYGTHTQLAALALAGRTAVLTAREIRRDWIYARDVVAGLIALIEAARPRHPVYNLSSGVEWVEPIRNWCETLKSAYPRFEYRVAEPGEAPNIWYTDQDRYPMDIGRIAQDMRFTPRYTMQAAYAHYLDWLQRTPDTLWPTS
ncbi:MAG TPA: NAD(P)-dependent oxidoreductase [Burkholderiales bacterium]|nr:NAD(P)-dependent oxidoreductase [Burkholderiales bacterium]